MPIIKALEIYMKHGRDYPENIATKEGMIIIDTSALVTMEGFMYRNYIYLRKGLSIARRQWCIAGALGHYLLGHIDNKTQERRGQAIDFAKALHSLTAICAGRYFNVGRDFTPTEDMKQKGVT